jgi:hypothetical protein
LCPLDHLSKSLAKEEALALKYWIQEVRKNRSGNID